MHSVKEVVDATYIALGKLTGLWKDLRYPGLGQTRKE